MDCTVIPLVRKERRRKVKKEGAMQVIIQILIHLSFVAFDTF